MAIDDFKVFNLDYEGKEINTALGNSLRKGNATGEGIESIDNDQFIVGQYNKVSSDYSFAVGNGTVSSRSNAFEVKRDGSIAINKTIDCNAFPENQNKTGAKGWFITAYRCQNPTQLMWVIQLSDTQVPYSEITDGLKSDLPAVTNFDVFKPGQTLTFYNDYHYINKLVILQLGSNKNELLVRALYQNNQQALPVRLMSLYPFRYGVYISGRVEGNENNIVFDDSLIDAGPSPLTFNSLTIGYDNVIGGYTSSIIGMGNRSYGQYSLTVGKDCNSSGYGTLNVGANNELHSEKTLIVGMNNDSEFNYNYVFGRYLKPTENNQMLIGVGKSDGSEIALPKNTRFAILDSSLRLSYSLTEGLKVSNGVSTTTVNASTSISTNEIKSSTTGYTKIGNIRTTNTGSINIGTSNSLSNKGGYLIGSNNKSTAATENCFVLGYGNNVSGPESVTIGSLNTNEKTKAMLIGSELTSSDRDQIIVGRGNATIASNIRFAIGGAVDSVNKKTVFTVDTSGNVKATGDIADKNGTTIAALLARIQALEAKVK